MRTIDVAPPAPDQTIAAALDEVAHRRLTAAAREAAAQLDGRRVVHVHTAAPARATDGVLGVGLLLDSLLPWARALGVDVRRVVLDSTPEHADLCRRLHHAWHGAAALRASGERVPSGADRRVYEEFLADEARELLDLVRPGDVVILHDPGTAGLAPHLAAADARVVWRCHLGVDTPDEVTEAAWAFVQSDLEECDAVVVTRGRYAPPWLSTAVVTPAIDPHSDTNAPAEPAEVVAELTAAGVLDGAGPASGALRGAGITHVVGGPVPTTARVVLQVGRWDPLKDPLGVLQAWEEGLETLPEDAHLVLAGPEPSAGSPAARVLDSLVQVWEGLDAETRARTHVLTLPTDDLTLNRRLVGLLQHHASVVVQKSVAEGWGLTVTEAMAKGRPVVATRVGGFTEQITHGTDGLLVDDAYDLEGFTDAIGVLLRDPTYAAALGREAALTVSRRHLPDRALQAWWEVLHPLLRERPEA